MRVFAAAAFVALCACACAQIAPDEKPIQDGYNLLRADAQVMVVLDGSDTFGQRVTQLYTTAAFDWDAGSGVPFAKVEVNDSINNALARRIVADGTTIWGFDFSKNAYTSLRYGAYSGAPPKGFRANMFDELTTDSRGQTTNVTRLLREVFGGDYAQYRTWFPGATITVVQDQTQNHPEFKLETWETGVASLDDPVISRSYAGSATEAYIVYTYPNRTQRSGAFRFTREDATKPWNLTDVYYGSRQAINPSTSRTVDWHVGIYTNPLSFPATPSYVFVPPSNSRAIANGRGPGG